MLTIRTRGNRAQLLGDIPDALRQDLRAQFSWVSPVDLTDELLFYCDETDVMYSGIIHDVREFIERRGIQCEIEFQPLPADRFDWRMLRPYRPLQEAFVDGLIECRYGVGQAPPGVGKTNVAAGTFCKLGLPGFMVVPNERPFVQAYNTLTEHTTIHNVGRWNGDNKELAEDGITVVTIQSLFSQLTNNPNSPLIRAWEKAQVVIVDEAHHGASDTHLNVFDMLKDVRYFFGLSATPWRDDDRNEILERVLGSIVHRITRAQAVTHRLNVPITVFVEDIPEKEYGFVVQEDVWDERAQRLVKRYVNKAAGQRARKGQKSPLDQVYDDYVINNPVRNGRALRFCQEAIEEGELSCVLSVKRLDHIKALQAMNPAVFALHGKTPDRNEVFERMQSKEQMLVASTLMDEAVDVSSLSCVAMLAGGSSTVKLEQRIRCDRVFEGNTVHGWFAKDRGYVWFPRDHADFLSSQASKCVAILKAICDEHEDHEFFLNGVQLKRGRKVPQYRRQTK